MLLYSENEELKRKLRRIKVLYINVLLCGNQSDFDDFIHTRNLRCRAWIWNSFLRLRLCVGEIAHKLFSFIYIFNIFLEVTDLAILFCTYIYLGYRVLSTHWILPKHLIISFRSLLLFKKLIFVRMYNYKYLFFNINVF